MVSPGPGLGAARGLGYHSHATGTQSCATRMSQKNNSYGEEAWGVEMLLVDKVMVECMEVSSADHIYEYEESVS